MKLSIEWPGLTQFLDLHQENILNYRGLKDSIQACPAEYISNKYASDWVQTWKQLIESSPLQPRQARSSTSAPARRAGRRGRNTSPPSTGRTRWLSSGRDWRWRCGCMTNFRRCTPFRLVLEINFKISWRSFIEDWTSSGNRFRWSPRHRRWSWEENLCEGISQWQIYSPLNAKFISENSHRFKYFARNNQRKIQINKYLFTCNVYTFFYFSNIFRNSWMTC